MIDTTPQGNWVSFDGFRVSYAEARRFARSVPPNPLQDNLSVEMQAPRCGRGSYSIGQTILESSVALTGVPSPYQEQSAIAGPATPPGQIIFQKDSEWAGNVLGAQQGTIQLNLMLFPSNLGPLMLAESQDDLQGIVTAGGSLPDFVQTVTVPNRVAQVLIAGPVMTQKFGQSDSWTGAPTQFTLSVNSGIEPFAGQWTVGAFDGNSQHNWTGDAGSVPALNGWDASGPISEGQPVVFKTAINGQYLELFWDTTGLTDSQALDVVPPGSPPRNSVALVDKGSFVRGQFNGPQADSPEYFTVDFTGTIAVTIPGVSTAHDLAIPWLPTSGGDVRLFVDIELQKQPMELLNLDESHETDHVIPFETTCTAQAVAQAEVGSQLYNLLLSTAPQLYSAVPGARAPFTVAFSSISIVNPNWPALPPNQELNFGLCGAIFTATGTTTNVIAPVFFNMVMQLPDGVDMPHTTLLAAQQDIFDVAAQLKWTKYGLFGAFDIPDPNTGAPETPDFFADRWLYYVAWAMNLQFLEEEHPPAIAFDAQFWNTGDE